MKILSLRLDGYNRLFLNRIKSLIYVPKEQIQIILGTNGSGKSSLLSMLNPLPSIKQDIFNKEIGYKEIHLEHHSKIYKISFTAGSKKHSFIVDDQELNDLGQKSLQLELIQKHFNLNHKVMDILLGVEAFTDFTPSTRKDWLITLSKIDFDYALRVYTQFKSRELELKGTISVVKEKINELKAKDVTEDRFKFLNDRYRNLNRIEEICLGAREIRDDQKDYKATLNQLQEEKRKWYTLAKGKILNLLTVDKNTIEELSLFYKIKRDHISDTKKKITQRAHEIQDCLRYIKKDMYQEVNEQSLDTIKLNITNSLNKLSKMELSTNLVLKIKDLLKGKVVNIEDTIKDFIKMKKDILALIRTIADITPHLVDLSFSKADAKSLLDITSDIKIHRSKIEVNLSTIEQLKSELEIMKTSTVQRHCKDCDQALVLTCPTCNKIVMLNTHKLDKIALNIKSYQEENELLNLKIKELEDHLQKGNERKEYLNDILKDHQDILKNDIVINYLFDLFEANILEELYIANSEKISYFQFKSNDIFVLLQKEYTVIETLYPELKLSLEEYFIVLNDINSKESELKEIELKLQSLTEEEQKFNRLLQITEDKLKDLRDFELYIKKYEETELNFNKVLEDYKYQKSLEALSKFIQVVKEEKQIIVDELIKIKSIQDSIRSQEELLQDCEKKYNVVKQINLALSPNSGLIAITLYTFLQELINNMNKVIRNVWSYDMEIILPPIEEMTSLSYRFPVKIENREMIEDISKLSAGMKSIVNLAFIIAFRSLMDIQDYPLYLDEFGNTFDHIHRKNAFDLIERLKNSLGCQFFIVSHFDSMYGTFKHADINSLDKSMITTNKQIKMDYF